MSSDRPVLRNVGACALLRGTSRRPVDVWAERELDVTRRELAGTSMPALHSRGVGRRSGPVNVSQVLDRRREDRFGWLASPAFRQLV
jgi:hypothetical protein